jgi:alpha-L-fucosidase 2
LWLAASLVVSLQADSFAEDLKLWYDKPAARWEQEALPIGNGRLGAMIYGGVDHEHIQFNEDTLWIGDEKDTGAFQAFGDVFLDFGSDCEDGKVVLAECTSGQSSPQGYSVFESSDEEQETQWCVAFQGRPVVWTGHCPGGKAVSSYALLSARDKPECDPKSWTLEGSSDGQTWTLLDQHKDEPPILKRHMRTTYTFANEKKFKLYRFTFQESHSPTHFQIAEIELSAQPKAIPANYRRELDIRRARQTVSYTEGGVTYRREYFASHPANVMVFRYTADKAGAYTGKILLRDAHKGAVSAVGNRLMAKGNLAGYQRGAQTEPYGSILDYESQVLVINEGGALEAKDGRIVFANVNALTIFLDAGTDYINQRSRHWRGAHPHEVITERLAKAAAAPYDKMLAVHTADYQSLFDRVALNVGMTEESIRQLSTDRRLVAYSSARPKAGGKEASSLKGSPDPELEALLFQYARYLMISCSRPGDLPANLQGVWNHVNMALWRCDYHTDINVQMNYWPVEPCNLPECFEPYSDWVESIRPVLTERTRKESKTRGWVMGAESGIFGGTTCFGYLSTSTWLLMNSYEHYLFTGDKNYLRTRAYPAMKELCEYWFDSLIEQPDGTLLTPMSHSPEHGPKDVGISFDRQQVWELFSNTIEASLALGVDEEMRRKLADMRARILPPKVGSWGQLLEWKEELKNQRVVGDAVGEIDTPGNKHRHISHMIAVFPGRQISPAKNPELAAAARVSLNARGDHATGWSAAHKMNVWARLREGERAYALARVILIHHTMPNMFTTHPPFQIDANFGYSSGICEMLVQSHERTGATSASGSPEVIVDLLPAIPKAWARGSVKGLKVRGGYTLDMEWQDGKVASYRIIAGDRADKTKPVKVRINGEVREVVPN